MENFTKYKSTKLFKNLEISFQKVFLQLQKQSVFDATNVFQPAGFDHRQLKNIEVHDKCPQPFTAPKRD